MTIKTDETTPTPRPWKWFHYPDGRKLLCAANRAVIHCPDSQMTINDSDAELIVRCVNSHEALVEALQGMLDRYTGLVNSGDAGNWNPEDEPDVIKARAALQQAGVTK